MSTTLTSALIIDDHWLFLEGLKTFLTHHYKCQHIFSADSAEGALQILQQHPDIDLMLVDLEMPGMGGLGFLQALRDNAIVVPAIVLSSSDHMPDIQAALKNGAMGFIPKALGNKDMEAAIQYVLDGNVFVPQGLQTALQNLASTGTGVVLSERQQQVLSGMHLGHSNQQIADQLCITVSTVKAHITKIFAILGVSSRISCLRRAEELGYLR